MAKSVTLPKTRMPVETLVQEQKSGDQLLWIEGLLPLPIGSRINPGNVPGHTPLPTNPARTSLDGVDAIVVSVNLWGIQSAVGCLVLEVELTEPHGPGDAPVS